jgi:hypothetical protein
MVEDASQDGRFAWCPHRESSVYLQDRRVLDCNSGGAYFSFFTWSASTATTFYQTNFISVRSSQLYLFIFMGAVAAGTLIGGPVGVASGASQYLGLDSWGASDSL